MLVMTTKKSAHQEKRVRPAMTVYGRFLQWVRFRYKINQTEQAKIMGTSQGTISNWQKGEFEASWQANVALAKHFRFGDELKRLHSAVFLYGQGEVMPADDPSDMPFGLADLVLTGEPPKTEQEEANIATFKERIDSRRSEGEDSGERGD